ncbi:MAG: hypothetical protein B7Z55_07305, partial [Planctomycetales bacterium 12-60-4]
VTLCLGSITEAGLHGLPPTTSTTAMLALGDALAVVVAESRGFTPQHFGRLHPGGSLGRRLSSVQDVMRKGAELRIAGQTATVREVLTRLCRPGRRTGAVMLVDAEGRLSGLFTDSDLARLLEQRRDGQLDRPISEVMTAGPITIPETAILAAAAAAAAAAAQAAAKAAAAVRAVAVAKAAADDCGSPVSDRGVWRLLGRHTAGSGAADPQSECSRWSDQRPAATCGKCPGCSNLSATTGVGGECEVSFEESIRIHFHQRMATTGCRKTHSTPAIRGGLAGEEPTDWPGRGGDHRQ